MSGGVGTVADRGKPKPGCDNPHHEFAPAGCGDFATSGSDMEATMQLDKMLGG